jgi:G:T/U-mismatch repair DNA glycosylase
MDRLEFHPYGAFIPKKTKYLLIGSFPISKFTNPAKRSEIKSHEIDFYFGGEKNFLWKILSHLFQTDLKSKKNIINFLTKEQIGIVDLINSCRRIQGHSSDSSLYDIEWNHQIDLLLKKYPIEYLIFTSKGVEQWFRRLYPQIKMPSLTLISPSAQSYRSLSPFLAYKKWKKTYPTRKPIEFIELYYRKTLSEIFDLPMKNIKDT